MADNFFDYMYGVNKKQEKTTEDSAPISEGNRVEQPVESVAQDEAIGEWTHKFVVYCKDPKKEFEEELKSKDGVVAVFMKEKESKSIPAEENPPNEK